MSITRRTFLGRSGILVGAALATPLSRLAAQPAPAAVTPDAARPAMPYGVQSGDVLGDRAIVWSRSDRPARMVVEWATSESFASSQRVIGPAAIEASDFTARVDLRGLPRGQRIFYRVAFEDLASPGVTSLPVVGSLQTPSVGRSDVTFAWSGDTAGQGWGINPEWGGMKIYETIRRARPHFFVHSGDQIYADGPIQAEVKLDDATVWKNLTTPAKAKVAETLDEFRGNFAYNLLDENVRRFNAEVPVFVQWDDHETRNNWYPGQLIGDPRYTVKSASLLSARARQAMFEYNALRFVPEEPERVYRSFGWGPSLDVFVLDERSYRGPNTPNRQSTLDETARFLGPAQLRWLEQSLAASRATWKLIASDMPLSIVVPDLNPDVPKGTYEAWANGDPGAPLGRELELAELLSFIRRQRIRNVVWITADVHYAAAIHYDPARARFTEFTPFWEFVAGPLNAGTFGPGEMDPTFGPEVRYRSIPDDLKQNTPPTAGMQFFGTGAVDARSGVLTMSLFNLNGDRLHSVELMPARN